MTGRSDSFSPSHRAWGHDRSGLLYAQAHQLAGTLTAETTAASCPAGCDFAMSSVSECAGDVEVSADPDDVTHGCGAPAEDVTPPTSAARVGTASAAAMAGVALMATLA